MKMSLFRCIYICTNFNSYTVPSQINTLKLNESGSSLSNNKHRIHSSFRPRMGCLTSLWLSLTSQLPTKSQTKLIQLFLDITAPVRRLFKFNHPQRRSPRFDANWPRHIHFPPEASQSTLTIFKIQCKSYRGLVLDRPPQYWLSLTIRGIRREVSVHQQPEASAASSQNTPHRIWSVSIIPQQISQGWATYLNRKEEMFNNHTDDSLSIQKWVSYCVCLCKCGSEGNGSINLNRCGKKILQFETPDVNSDSGKL